MDKFNDILSYACSRWNNSIVICRDMNFDLSKPDEPIQKHYLSILLSHNLNQHIKKPTCKTAILDHIITNSITKVKHVNVIPCLEVSDHDAPYITLSTKFAPFEPGYKIICDMKNFRQQDFIDLFPTLTPEIIYDWEYLSNENDSTVFLQPTDKEEIPNIISSLDSSKVSG